MYVGVHSKSLEYLSETFIRTVVYITEIVQGGENDNRENY